MIPKLAPLIILSALTVSCHFPFSGKPDKVALNKITETAHKFNAKYGIEYILKGNRIAQYPDFNINLHSTTTCPHNSSTIYTYEISSKDGYEKRQITINSNETDKKHFYVENTHFYFHSNGAYSLNIYMPPQLLALN